MTSDKDKKIFMSRLTEAQAELFGFIASMMPLCPDDVNDVAQNTNLALIEHAEEYDCDKPFTPWMLQFARHEMSHFFRSKGRSRVVFDDEVVGKSAAYLAEDDEDGTKEGTLKRLAVCKKKLNERQQKLVELRYTFLYNVEEIARLLQKKPSQITFALVYIRGKLADCLKRLCRMSDEEFEEGHIDELSSLCGDLIDGTEQGFQRKEKWQRLNGMVKDSDSFLHRYLDQMYVHQLLAQRWIANGKKARNVPAKTFSWLKIAAAAALALLLASVLVAKHRFSPKIAETQRISKTIQPAAQTAPPVFEEKQARTLPSPALTTTETLFAASAPATNLQQEMPNGNSAASNTQKKEKDMNASMLSQAVTAAAEVAAASAICLTPAEIVRAGTPYYWDNNGTAAGFGAAGGTWGADALWSADAAGLAAPVKTATDTGDDLYFGTASNGLSSGVVSLSGTNSFASLTFGGASGSITLTNGALNLTASETPFIVENASNILTSSLTGTGGVHFVAGGTSYMFHDYVTDAWQTVFTNTSLSEIDSIDATMVGSGLGTRQAYPCFFMNDGVNASVQFQGNDGRLKCVKVAFRQNGANVEAKDVYAKYYDSLNSSLFGLDFDTTNDPLIKAFSFFVSDASTGGYGIKWLTVFGAHTMHMRGSHSFTGDMRIDGGSELSLSGILSDGRYNGAITNTGRIVWNASTNQTLCGTLTGNGSLTIEGQSYSGILAWTNFLSSTNWTVILPNADLSDCTGIVSAVSGGLNIGNYAFTPCYFKNNGSTATCQLQANLGGWIKCVLLTLCQDLTNVMARTTAAYYITATGHSVGFDFENETGWTQRKDLSSSEKDNGYGIASFSIGLNGRGNLILSGKTANIGGITINGGRCFACGSRALPQLGPIVVKNGGKLLLAGQSLASTGGGVSQNNAILLTNNASLVTYSSFNTGFSQPLFLDGSSLNLAMNGGPDGGNYINKLTLKNNSRVIGYALRIGHGSSALYEVKGTSPSSILSGINLVNDASLTSRLTLSVEDVTGDTNIDLFASGRLTDFAGLERCPIFKTGEGTMQFAMTNTSWTTLEIDAGKILLASNKALNTSNTVILAGGSLSLGSSTNAAGSLILGANSTISLDRGQIAFADSSALAWTNNCRLTLTGTLLPHSLRFGANKQSLTASQLSAIRYNKGSVVLTNDGYIKESPKGTVVMLM